MDSRAFKDFFEELSKKIDDDDNGNLMWFTNLRGGFLFILKIHRVYCIFFFILILYKGMLS